jgi:hypothetical protein
MEVVTLRTLLRVAVLGSIIAALAGATDRARAADGGARASAQPSSPAGGDLVVGGKVVAAQDQNALGFQLGTVASIDGPNVVVERTFPSGVRTSATFERSRVWRADLPPRPPVQEGESLICEGNAYMPSGNPSPCRVVAVGPKGASCEDLFGLRFPCDPLRLVRPDAATQTAIGAYLARQAHNREFQKAARAAGKPSKTDGWKPKVGAKILIHNTVNDDWYVGVVKSIQRGEIVIHEQVSWDVTLEADAEFVPVPVRPQRAAVGAYVLAQRSPDHWSYGVVVAVQEQTFEVADGYGQRQRLAATDIIPLRPVDR